MKLDPVPASINELVIDRHFAIDPITRGKVSDNTLTNLFDAMRLARTTVEKARSVAVAIHTNETLTVPARHKRVKDEAWKLIESGTRALDAARQRAESELAALRASIATPARRNDAAQVILEGEIRARLATLTPDARRLALATAIHRGEDVIVGAALTGPAMLSGLDNPQEQDVLRERWQLARFPETMERIERVVRAIADVERVGPLVVNYMGSLYDQKILAVAERSEADMQAALNS